MAIELYIPQYQGVLHTFFGLVTRKVASGDPLSIAEIAACLPIAPENETEMAKLQAKRGPFLLDRTLQPPLVSNLGTTVKAKMIDAVIGLFHLSIPDKVLFNLTETGNGPVLDSVPASNRIQLSCQFLRDELAIGPDFSLARVSVLREEFGLALRDCTADPANCGVGHDIEIRFIAQQPSARQLAKAALKQGGAVRRFSRTAALLIGDSCCGPCAPVRFSSFFVVREKADPQICILLEVEGGEDKIDKTKYDVLGGPIAGDGAGRERQRAELCARA